MDAAEKHIATMKECGELITRRTIVCLLCAYANNGAIDRILHEIGKYNSDGIEFDQGDYLQVIYELSVNGHTSAALKIIPLMKLTFGRDQEVLNTMIRIIQKNGLEVAFELLLLTKKRTDDVLGIMAKHFVRQMIRAKCPLDTCMEYAAKLQKLTGNSEHYFNMLMTYSQRASIEEQLDLLRMIKSKSIKMNVFFFRPLMISDVTKDYFSLIRTMVYEFNVQPTAQFLRECILPSMDMKEPLKVLYNLLKVNVNKGAALTSVVYECLRRNKLRDAADITGVHPMFMHPSLLKRDLTDALIRTDDYDSYCQLIYNLYRNYDLVYSISDIDRGDRNREDMTGAMVYTAMAAFDADIRVHNTKRILTDFLREGMAISKSYAVEIQRTFKHDVTGELATLLDTLSSGRNIPSEVRKTRPFVRSTEKMAVSTAATESAMRYASRRPNHNINTNKTDAVRALEEAIESKDVVRMQNCYNALTTGDYVNIVTLVSLIETLATENDLVAAKNILIRLLRKGLFVPGLTRLLRYFATAGDVDSLKAIEPYIDPRQLAKFKFLPSLAIAHVKVGRGEEFIDHLGQRLHQCESSSALQILETAFPIPQMYRLLDQHPEFNPKCEY